MITGHQGNYYRAPYKKSGQVTIKGHPATNIGYLATIIGCLTTIIGCQVTMIGCWATIIGHPTGPYFWLFEDLIKFLSGFQTFNFQILRPSNQALLSFALKKIHALVP